MIEELNGMKNIFLNKRRKFSIRKLTIGTISVAVGLVFVNDITGMSRVEASLSVDDSNYINQTAPNNGALVEYIRQALATISKAADSTVLPTSIQNLKNKVQSLSTKNESDYTESAWQEFQGKLTTAKSKLDEAERAYNKAVSIKPNASSYETTINELITSYPEYSTVVIRVRDGETTEAAETRHLTNIRRINQVLTAKYAELRETAQLVKEVLPPVGGDIAAQQLNIITSAEKILDLNRKESTVAQEQHADLMAGLFEDHKVVLSEASYLRGAITPEDQTKIKAFLEAYSPSRGETSVFTTYAGALEYRFNNDGTITITYTDDHSSDTVPLSSFVKGGATQTDSPAVTYTVTYNYVSGTPDKTLPSTITAPAAVNEKHTGDVVASPTDQTDVEDAANQGTWHFTSWDKPSVTVGTADETVTGTWTFIATPGTTPGTATPGETPGTTPGTETPGGTPETTPGTTIPGATPGTTSGTATPGETPGTTPGTAAPGETPGTTPGTTTPGETPGTTPGTATPGETPGTTPGTTTPGETPGTTPGTATPGETPSTTPGTATPGENPGTTPGTAAPGETPGTTPGTTTPGETPGTTPGTATPGETPGTTPGTTTPGGAPGTTSGTTAPEENPSTTPGTATPGATPGTTPGTVTPGATPGTTPGTVTPGETPGTTPGTATSGATPGATPGTATSGEKPDTTPGTATPGENPSTTPDTVTPGENPSTTPDTVTPRTTDLYMSGREGKTLSNSVAEGWSKEDGHWFYQLEDGSHIVNEWKQINGTWYRFNNSGVMQTGWVKDNGTWYYLNNSGAMQTGWVKDKGTWYYLNSSGAMQTGWVKDKGIWYYLNQSGAMETGWFTVSGKWYYANESGALATNTITPDGYIVNADGEWVE